MASRRDGRERERWEGTLSMSPRGFGFAAAAGQDDVYIPPEAVGGALHGDRVTIEVVSRSGRGPEARITGIVKRRNPRVAGLLRRRGRSSWIEPDDTRVRGPIVLVAGPRLGRDGEAAVAQITRFPAHSNENPEGELIAVLGAPGDPNVEVAKILVREGVEEEHPEGAVREGEAMASRRLPKATGARRDLTSVPLPTIDPEDARDHDDAIWVERRGDGYRAYIAIADVSEFVQDRSELDAEARARGCTIYLPDRAIPMLPSALAADLCSLLPERERFCLCVIAELSGSGSVTRFEVVEGVMRSQAMLTYGGVARALGFSEAPPRSAQAEAMKKDLKVLDELARKLRKGRLSRGALDLDLPEPKLTLDPKTGAPLDVVRRTQDPGVRRAYSMVEELMLLANELVARFLGERKSPAVYRVHGPPDEAKLERLATVAERLGVALDLGDLQQPGGVSRWLGRIQKHPRRAVLEMLLLRTLKQAIYDPNNIGHFGLASAAYVHFTSPIRRYPDLLVHRAVKRLLHGEKPNRSAAALEALAAAARESSEQERRAMDIEREVVDLYRALLMRDRIGLSAQGTVTGLAGSGVFVTLDQPFVEVMVRFEAMGPDRYELSDDELRVVGARSGDSVALGDSMMVTIDDVAVLRRTVYAMRVLPEELLSKLESLRGKRQSKLEARGGRQKRPPARPAPAANRPGPRRPKSGGGAKARDDQPRKRRRRR